MQINQSAIQSFHFSGEPQTVLKDLESFLLEMRTKNPGANEYTLVHALILDKEMHSTEVMSFNKKLADLYRRTNFTVLGGDTSSGFELGLFVSTIITR